MTSTDILNYFKGYVEVSIRGRQPERFINLVMQKNIYLWDVKRKEGEITFKISRKGFFLIRSAAFKTGIKVKIIKKYGFFMFARKMKKRKLLAISFIAFFIALNILSLFVLKIDVVGNEQIPKEKIIAKLKEIDLKKFTLRSNIDVDRISVELRNGFDLIAWVGVYEKGTSITVEIKERVKPPKILPLDVPCDIVAKRGGIIETLTVENGEKAVALGQMVAEGQVLIKGTVPIRDKEEKRYVHSMGKIMAHTEYIKENEFKLYTYEKKYTGREKKIHNFSVFGNYIYKGRENPFFNGDRDLKKKVMGIFEFDTVTYREYTLHKTPRKKEEAEAEVKKDMEAEFKKELPKDILKEIVYEITYKDNETGIIKATAKCFEDIAKEKEIEKCPSELSAQIPMKQ